MYTMARSLSRSYVLIRFRLIRKFYLCVHKRSLGTYITVNTPNVLRKMQIHIIGSHISISQTKEELHLTTDCNLVIDFMWVAQCKFCKILCAYTKVRNIVILLCTRSFRKFKKRFRQGNTGIWTHVKFNQVHTIKSLKANTKNLIFQVSRDAVIVLQSAQELVSVNTWMHKGGKIIATI